MSSFQSRRSPGTVERAPSRRRKTPRSRMGQSVGSADDLFHQCLSLGSRFNHSCLRTANWIG
jgi:hypothetical protein